MKYLLLASLFVGSTTFASSILNFDSDTSDLLTELSHCTSSFEKAMTKATEVGEVTKSAPRPRIRGMRTEVYSIKTYAVTGEPPTLNEVAELEITKDIDGRVPGNEQVTRNCKVIPAKP